MRHAQPIYYKWPFLHGEIKKSVSDALKSLLCCIFACQLYAAENLLQQSCALVDGILIQEDHAVEIAGVLSQCIAGGRTGCTGQAVAENVPCCHIIQLHLYQSIDLVDFEVSYETALNGFQKSVDLG